jgi:intracellular proteinase inhibitor BsuPI
VTAGGSGLRLQLLAPARVPQGEPVRFTLHIVNAGDRPALLYLQGRPPAFDLEVRDGSGRILWRRLAGATIQMVLGLRELAPGEGLDFEDIWPQQDQAGRPVPPGRYRLTGVLPGELDRALRSADITLEITTP